MTDQTTISTEAAQAVLEGRDGWQKFGVSMFHTVPDERFTISIDPSPGGISDLGVDRVAVRVYGPKVEGLDGEPAVIAKIAATPTGNLAAAAVAALAEHLERQMEGS